MARLLLLLQLGPASAAGVVEYLTEGTGRLAGRTGGGIGGDGPKVPPCEVFDGQAPFAV